MRSPETLARRAEERKLQRVSDALSEAGFTIYALESVRTSRSPHIAVKAILKKIVEAAQ